MNYSHTQRGYLIIVVLAVVAVFFSFLYGVVGFQSGFVFVSLAVLVILSGFSSLTINIDKYFLRVKFGWGIYKTSFNLKDIKSVKTVKHNWCAGWGIRFWFWPKMIIYNVSGFDMVEIVLKNNKIYRLGTDEPDKLKKAIEKSIS